MRFGFVMATGDAADVADAAVLAEEAGWDALFTWEALWGVDAWVSLTAAAMVTERIRLGTMLTPLPRYKPWDVASRVATLDRLSGGRVQLAVGLGALHEGWTAFEDDEGRRVRAEKLDEGLAVYDGLMRGQPFSFSGKHFRASPTTFALPPPPVQRPRVPVWVVGAHPAPRSMARAARWDGLLPMVLSPDVGPPETPERLAEVVAACRAERESAGLPWDGFDVVVEGTSAPGPTGWTAVRPWAEAGATWWVESDWSGGEDALARLRDRIVAGPPRDPTQ
jgi:alkanesulfonate monooxygenase SsuD/methylene tetrahydromethanopterin reductase-like flavin-dependent oxidoreductase (luciferase family)